MEHNKAILGEVRDSLVYNSADPKANLKRDVDDVAISTKVAGDEAAASNKKAKTLLVSLRRTNDNTPCRRRCCRYCGQPKTAMFVSDVYGWKDHFVYVVFCFLTILSLSAFSSVGYSHM